MQRFYWFFILAFICGQGMLCAQEVKIIEGQILNDTVGRSLLNVVNLNLKKGAVTDIEGRFEISVTRGDTLHVSGLQYEAKLIIVGNQVFKKGYTTFYLEPKITELDEVVLSTISLSGDLEKDVVSVSKEAAFGPEDFGLPENTAKKRTVEERRMYAGESGINTEGVTLGLGLIVPLPLLINSISGRRKRLHKHVAVSNFQRSVDNYRATFSLSVYEEEFGIPKDLIDDFVFYVLDTSDEWPSLKRKDRIMLFDFFKEKGPKYLELKKNEKEIPNPKN